MASQTRSPGTLADDAAVGTVTWTNPSNAGTSNNVYAVSLSNESGLGRFSHYLKATNFGFSIPTGSTINGVVVEIEEFTWDPVACKNIVVRLVKGGSVSGDNKATGSFISDVESYVSYGGASDLWGNTLALSDINASNFGMVLQVFTDEASDVFVDHIRITVHYTSPDKDVTASDSVSTSESTKMELNSNIAKSESVNVSESAQLTTSAPQVNKSDSITVTEQTTVSIPVSAIASDSITLGENTKLSVPINTQSSDNITITESTTINIPINLAVMDSITTSESVSNEVPVGLSVNDSINTNDSFSPNQNSFIGTGDTLNTTESTILDVLVALANSQNITITEAIQLLVSDAKLSTSDAITVIESFLVELSTEIAKTEGISLSEDTKLSVETNVPVSDLITIAEAYNIVLPDALRINSSDAIAVTELFSGNSVIADYYISVFDTVSVLDSVGDIGLADIIEVGKKLVMVEGRLAYLIAGKNSFPIYVFI